MCRYGDGNRCCTRGHRDRRARVRSAKVTFEVADVFSLTTSAQFVVVFFSAWLSQVPASMFEQFWRLLRRLLVVGGRVLFIDEHVDEREKESYVADREEVVERRLSDGEAFRVIKNFVDPERLEARLRGMGWECEIRRDGSDWICGEARPALTDALEEGDAGTYAPPDDRHTRG